jgi:hypothetical protein
MAVWGFGNFAAAAACSPCRLCLDPTNTTDAAATMHATLPTGSRPRTATRPSPRAPPPPARWWPPSPSRGSTRRPPPRPARRTTAAPCACAPGRPATSGSSCRAGTRSTRRATPPGCRSTTRAPSAATSEFFFTLMMPCMHATWSHQTLTHAPAPLPPLRMPGCPPTTTPTKPERRRRRSTRRTGAARRRRSATTSLCTFDCLIVI